MADHQITPGQRGAYELPIHGGHAIDVTITAGPTIAQVIHHSGDTPIYVSVNRTADPGDPASRIVTPGSWIDLALDVAHNNLVHITTRTDAIVSVTLP